MNLTIRRVDLSPKGKMFFVIDENENNAFPTKHGHLGWSTKKEALKIIEAINRLGLEEVKRKIEEASK